MKKVCSVCKEEKDIEEFSWKEKKKNKRQPLCKDCKKSIDRRYYISNKERREGIRKRADKWNFSFKEWFNSLKQEYVCEKCGENRAHVLDFHHIDPNKKDFTISSKATFSRKRILEEVKKCIVLCSNCHRDFHYNERINGISIEEYLLRDYSSVMVEQRTENSFVAGSIPANPNSG